MSSSNIRHRHLFKFIWVPFTCICSSDDPGCKVFFRSTIVCFVVVLISGWIHFSFRDPSPHFRSMHLSGSFENLAFLSSLTPSSTRLTPSSKSRYRIALLLAVLLRVFGSAPLFFVLLETFWNHVSLFTLSTDPLRYLYNLRGFFFYGLKMAS